MTNPYLERCKAIAADIDVDILAERPLGDVVGKNGSGYSFRQHGVLPLHTLGDTELYAGMKLPLHSGQDTRMRVRNEAGFIGMMATEAPDIMPNMPGFMNLVVVEDTNETGILTEDVSAGGQYEVRSRPASAEVRDMFRTAFASMAIQGDVVRSEECDRTVAFEAGGDEKLLDFTPLPVDSSYLMLHPAFKEAAYDTYTDMPELTITVPADSPLGQSMQRR